jgi:hypothetical protein
LQELALGWALTQDGSFTANGRQTMRHSVKSFASSLVLLAGIVFSLPALALESAGDALDKAYDAMLESRGVIETVARAGTGDPTRSRIEFDTLRRMRMISDETSMIVTPEGTWMRSGDSGWMQPPIDMSAMIERLLPVSREALRSGTSNIRDEGMQSIDGLELRAISYDMATKVMGIEVKSRNIAFIDGAGRIVRTRSDGETMGRKTHSEQTIRYDDSIRVTAPD